VDPQRRAAPGDERLGIRHEAGVEQRSGEARMDAPARRRVVRDDHGGAVVRLVEARIQPRRVPREPLRRDVGREPRTPLVDADAGEIVHHAERLDERRGAQVARAVQREVAPQRRAEEAHAVDHDRLVVEDAHVGACRECGERRGGLGEARAVELVVAGDVDDALGQAARPRDRFGRPRDVAREHDHVGIGRGDVERALRQVQVGEDLEAHD
jgi:hypothetical protein